MATKKDDFPSKDVTIAEICLRYPHLIEQINVQLKNETLVKFKETSKLVSKITTKQKCRKFLWMRWIQSNIGEFTEDWINAINKSSAETLKIFAKIVHAFFKNKPGRRHRYWSPMHIGKEN